MPKSEKREQAIREHPTQTRFPDLDALLRSYGFRRSQPRGGSSHYTYRHERLPGLLTIPWHGSGFVKTGYVNAALARIDLVKEQLA